MNKNQSSARIIEHKISALKIPNIDVHDRLMNRLTSITPSSPVPQQKKRSYMVLYAAVLAILVIGSGYAGLHWLQLNHQQAEQSWTIRPFNSENSPPVSLEAESEQMAMQHLQPGDGLLIPNPDNPSSSSVLLIKPYVYEDWATLRQALGHRDDLPHALPDEYDFLQAELSVNADPLDVVPGEQSRLIREIGSPTDWSVLSIKLQRQMLVFHASISREVFSDTIYTRLDGDHRIVDIDGNDAAIIRDSQGVRLYWKNHAESAWTYIISAPPAASDDQLITLLTSLIPEHTP